MQRSNVARVLGGDQRPPRDHDPLDPGEVARARVEPAREHRCRRPGAWPAPTSSASHGARRTGPRSARNHVEPVRAAEQRAAGSWRTTSRGSAVARRRRTAGWRGSRPSASPTPASRSACDELDVEPEALAVRARDASASSLTSLRGDQRAPAARASSASATAPLPVPTSSTREPSAQRRAPPRRASRSPGAGRARADRRAGRCARKPLPPSR